MLTIEPTGAVLGATVRGVDLAQSLGESYWRSAGTGCFASRTSI
jgi:hypothetical protein